jgi:hypothetical protein
MLAELSEIVDLLAQGLSCDASLCRESATEGNVG